MVCLRDPIRNAILRRFSCGVVVRLGWVFPMCEAAFVTTAKASAVSEGQPCLEAEHYVELRVLCLVARSLAVEQ
jgi:hypothetical protein